MKQTNLIPETKSLLMASIDVPVPVQLRRLEDNCMLVFPLDSFRESYIRQACTRLKWEEDLKFKASTNRADRTICVTRSA